MQRLVLRCVPFDRAAFEAAVSDACRAAPDSEQTEQVRYLAGYLGPNGLKIQTILVESPYVDRHYIEEYSRYYASSFRAPPSSTVRLHFFTEKLTDDQVIAEITEAAHGGTQREVVQQRLQASHKGFVVVRPLPSAPIGRTVLAVYSDKDSRRFC